jgi:DAPG hydrolase PhiG domain
MGGLLAGSADRYLGYRGDDADTPYGKFFQPGMAPLPRHVTEALEHGPQAGPALLAFDDAAALAGDGYLQTENGYGVLADGSVAVSVHTDMPGVTPQMWSWWFGWHGSDSRRYKLWHPRAHVSAVWQDGEDAGRRGSARYVGRTSLITEYIGSSLLRAAIRFVRPATFGLPAADDGVVPVCARLGSSDVPVDAGWVVHHIRATGDGSEMRSRFWLGGPHIAVRNVPGLANLIVRPVVSRFLGLSTDYARTLMVHCAQEMNHLAGFLAPLYEQFGDE